MFSVWVMGAKSAEQQDLMIHRRRTESKVVENETDEMRILLMLFLAR